MKILVNSIKSIGLRLDKKFNWRSFVNKDIYSSDYVKPVCLPLSDALSRSSFSGSQQVVAGWGRTENCEFPLKSLSEYHQFTIKINFYQLHRVTLNWRCHCRWSRTKSARSCTRGTPAWSLTRVKCAPAALRGATRAPATAAAPWSWPRRTSGKAPRTRKVWIWRLIFSLLSAGTSPASCPSAPRTAARRTCPGSTREWPPSCPGSWTIWKREWEFLKSVCKYRRESVWLEWNWLPSVWNKLLIPLYKQQKLRVSLLKSHPLIRTQMQIVVLFYSC